MRFQSRSATKILGISVHELARRKLDCLQYEFSSNGLREDTKTSDYERLEKNRKRRLLKEHSSEKNNSAIIGQYCKKCRKELLLPIKAYVCLDGHFHTESQVTKYNKKYCCCGPSSCKMKFMQDLGENGIRFV